MDPDCAICSQPAIARCSCESQGLDKAVRQAEHRMMKSVLNNIRMWVRSHAQDYILEYFGMLKARRRETHTATMRRLNERAAYYSPHARPHPSEVRAADLELKRGIDEDWRASVHRYPEVLEYFYSLVELSVPADDEACVLDPPLSALAGGSARRVRLLESGERDREGERAAADRRRVVFSGPGAAPGLLVRERRAPPLAPMPLGAPVPPMRGPAYPYGPAPPAYM